MFPQHRDFNLSSTPVTQVGRLPFPLVPPWWRSNVPQTKLSLGVKYYNTFSGWNAWEYLLTDLKFHIRPLRISTLLSVMCCQHMFPNFSYLFFAVYQPNLVQADKHCLQTPTTYSNIVEIYTFFHIGPSLRFHPYTRMINVIIRKPHKWQVILPTDLPR